MSGSAAPLRVRFAPSPTGSMHLGNARTALFNWLVARQSGGRLVLRIEDTDVDRGQTGSEEAILADLRWLGLGWDEGPDLAGEHGPYRQSERGPLYADAVSDLLASGRAYRCYCEESRLEHERQRRVAAGRPPHYPGYCREVPADESAQRARAGEPFAVRFRIDTDSGSETGEVVEFFDRLRGRVEFPLRELGDTVIVRRNGRPTYNFAVVVDDAAMKIDLVLRGDDHLSNTPRQVLLFRALDRRPPEFAHLPMVRGADGSRLSKRHGAVSVAEYRRLGYPVEGLINALALLGWSPGGDRTLVTGEELLREFDIDRISRSPATFDQARLDWICSQYLQKKPGSDLVEPVLGRLVAAGLLSGELPEGSAAWAAELGELLRSSISHYDEVPRRSAGLFWSGGEPADPDAREALEGEGAQRVVQALARHARDDPPEDLERWREVRARVRDTAGVKGKSLFRPIRVAITGRTTGPELDRLVPLVTRGQRLFPDHVASVEARASRTAEWLTAG